MLIYIFPILVAAGILLLVIGVAASRSVDPVQARLTQLGTTQARNLEELELQQPLSERTLRPIVVRLSRAGSRLGNASSADTAERRLAMAGNPGDLRVSDWIGVKLLAGIVAGVLLFFVFGVAMFNGSWLDPVVLVERAIFGLLGLGIGYLMPEFWLGNKIKARQKIMLKMIPDTLDLLTISVRAGLGFDAALAKVVEKMPGPLTDEFRRALAEVRVGKSRRDALRDMIPRTQVAPLSNFIGAIIQAEQLGVSISKVLQVQSEQLRIERRQRAEQQAARAPIKMLFPLVGCIFPSLFLVILGPAFISILRTMSSGVIP
jgi:tight adherence protein C